MTSRIKLQPKRTTCNIPEIRMDWMPMKMGSRAKNANLPGPTNLTPISRQPTTVPTVPATSQAQAQPTICNQATQTAQGGSTASFDRISVTLPAGAGNFGIAFLQGNPTSILVCYQAGQSGIAINASTGEEIRREVSQSAAGQILDRVKAGVSARGASPNRIAAPNTGDAGLR